MVDHRMFAHEIELMNVSAAESDFLLSFLNDRTQFVCAGDTVSTTFRIDIGLPQGSPALPMILNISSNATSRADYKCTRTTRRGIIDQNSEFSRIDE
jgi:hypothetical protein